jgi:hypothetical protein
MTRVSYDGRVQETFDWEGEAEVLANKVEDLVEKTRAESVRSFAQAILHGDERHRAWLLQAAEDWVNRADVQRP